MFSFLNLTSFVLISLLVVFSPILASLKKSLSNNKIFFTIFALQNTWDNTTVQLHSYVSSIYTINILKWKCKSIFKYAFDFLKLQTKKNAV